MSTRRQRRMRKARQQQALSMSSDTNTSSLFGDDDLQGELSLGGFDARNFVIVDQDWRQVEYINGYHAARKGSSELDCPHLAEGKPEPGTEDAKRVYFWMMGHGAYVDGPVPQEDPVAMSSWVEYEGPKGGKGWKNTDTGKVTYQEDKPGDEESLSDESKSGKAAKKEEKAVVATAKGLHEAFPDIVEMDNSKHNNIWFNAIGNKELSNALGKIGGKNSNSKPGMVRLTNKPKYVLAAAAILSGKSPAALAKYYHDHIYKAKKSELKTNPSKSKSESVSSSGVIGTSLNTGKAVDFTPETASKYLNEVADHIGLSPKKLLSVLSDPAPATKGYNATVRGKVENYLIDNSLHVENAVSQYMDKVHDATEASSYASAIGKGDKKRIATEYAQTPIYDLQTVDYIESRNKPVSGKAYYQSSGGKAKVVMGTTSVTGDFRHELGHAVRFAYPNDSHGAKEVARHYSEVRKRVKENPPKSPKLSYEEYETNYGIIGRRALDNKEEDFAEHYRGFHRELYRDREAKTDKHMKQYRERHPTMANLFDARYTAAMMVMMATESNS